MKRIQSFVLIAYLAFSIAFAVFDRVKNDIALCNSFVAGLLTWIVYALYAIVSFSLLGYSIAKRSGFRAAFPVTFLVFAMTAMFVFAVPLTNVYTNINYKRYYDERMEIVEMYSNGQLSKYQIGYEEYLVPGRSASYTGTTLVQDENGVVKLLFYVYRGLTITKIVVFVSDDSGLSKKDFAAGLPQHSQNYMNIVKMDDCWYAATVRA